MLREFLFHAPIAVEKIKFSSENNKHGYSPNNPAVFFGHYWLSAIDGPKLQAANVCCLDYSVAKGGILAAYRYYHDQPISEVNFVTIESLN